jgi:heat-inducible transcriptional repressor
LVQRYALNLSAASVRKVLAELEQLGLLSQAHASAGRAPTEQGYKLYVDQLLKIGGLAPSARRILNEGLATKEGKRASAFALMSRLLTELTSHMGLVMAPIQEAINFKRIYFVRLGLSRVLAVLVTVNGVIQNRLLNPPQDYTQNELNEVNVYLEDIPAPYNLEKIKTTLVEAMGKEKNRFEQLYLRAITLAVEAQSAGEEVKNSEGNIYMDDEGRGKLIEHPDFSDVDAMRALFRAFENKRRLIELLNEITGGGKVRVVIGPSGQEADGLALVASPFDGPAGAGALGVLGPRRLNYSEIVPVVDYAAQVASELFSK